MNNLDLELQTLPGAEVQGTFENGRTKHISPNISQTGVPTNGRQRLLNRDFHSL
jgi:hypothetical protein